MVRGPGLGDQRCNAVHLFEHSTVMGVVPSRCFPNQPNLHLTLFGELRTLHLTLFVELRCPTSHQFRRWCAGVHRIGQRRTLFTITFGRQLLFTVILCRQLLRSNRLLMSFLFTIILRSATLGRRSYWKQPNLARSLTLFLMKRDVDCIYVT